MTNYLLDQIFVKCSSQTLCGIKPANLFSVPCRDYSESVFEEWKKVVKGQGLSIVSFERGPVVVVFVYDFAWIRKILGDSFVCAYLSGKGYSDVLDTGKTLDELFVQLRESEGFPHEVGIFLGYPIEDVICFEINEGKQCKYCGYWKSYCNPEEAKKCCDRFRECSRICKQWFEEGYSVPQIIEKYKKMALEAA